MSVEKLQLSVVCCIQEEAGACQHKATTPLCLHDAKAAAVVMFYDFHKLRR